MQSSQFELHEVFTDSSQPDLEPEQRGNPLVSTPVEKVTNVAGENVTPGGGDEPLVRRLLLCSCSLSLGG